MFGDGAAQAGRVVPRGVRGGHQAATPTPGVVPIENLVNGTIRETFDLLLEHELVIDARGRRSRSTCASLALPGRPLESIERVYSHIQALGQAERFLRTRPWSLLTTYNTAGAGRFIARACRHGAAAVAVARGPRRRSGSRSSPTSIQDVRRQPDAVPRRRDARMPAPDAGPSVPRVRGARRAVPRRRSPSASATSPGTLLAALQALRHARSINLSQPRVPPEPGGARWEYVFWADLDARPARAGLRRGPRRPRGGSRRWSGSSGTYPRAARTEQDRTARIAPPTDDARCRDADQHLGPRSTTEE